MKRPFLKRPFLKRPFLFLLVFFAALALTACEEAYSGKLILSGTHRLARGEVIDGELAVAGGDVTLEAGSRVNGSIYMLNASLVVDGEIGGDITFVGGSLELGPHARVAGMINSGGKLTRSPEARVGGEVNTGTGIEIPSSSTLTRRSVQNRLIWLLPQALFVAGLAFLAVRFIPHAVTRTSAAVTGHPLVSAAMGVLLGIVGLSLLVLMAFTILLIPVTLLGLFLLGGAVVFGWIAFGQAVGRFLAGRLKRELRPEAAAFLGTLLFMLLTGAAAFIPFVGGLFGILVAAAGLGAALLTRFGTRIFVPAVELEESEIEEVCL